LFLTLAVLIPGTYFLLGVVPFFFGLEVCDPSTFSEPVTPKKLSPFKPVYL